MIEEHCLCHAMGSNLFILKASFPHEPIQCAVLGRNLVKSFLHKVGIEKTSFNHELIQFACPVCLLSFF